ncbi:MAG: cell division protein FtsA [Candidatus Aureabacteria bacterium]|nr:cell division protein FtsA [Candidatus Auribacterota bacterium]
MVKEGEEIIVGLDIGTTKVCAMVGLKRPSVETLELIGVGTVPSKGIKKGGIVDMESATESVLAAIEIAEQTADVEINNVFVNVDGSHIRGINSYGTTAITHPRFEITEEDIEKTIASAKAVSIPMERMVLHVLPHEYTVDGQSGIRNPRGMSGVKLEVGVHIVTAMISSVQNILKSLHQADLECEDLVLTPLASAEGILSQEEKEMGVVLIDIGGGTSDTIVYTDGMVKFTDVLGSGGYQVTNDVASALGIPLNKAEEIKKNQGCAIRSVLGIADEFEVPGVLGRPARRMASRDLASIIEVRVEEMLMIIRKKIEAAALSEKIGSGVVLTGGTSLLKNIDKLATRVFNVPVQIGKLKGITGLNPSLDSPVYATSLGLLEFGLQMRRKNKPVVNRKKRMKEFTDWIKSFFRKG